MIKYSDSEVGKNRSPREKRPAKGREPLWRKEWLVTERS